MNLEKTKLPRLLASITSVVAAVVGLVLIGILPVINLAGGPVTFGDYISQFIYMIKNSSSIDPGMISLYLSSIANIVIYLVTYIVGLVFLIKCIISLAKFNKEGSAKRITFNSLKLSITVLAFFAFTVFFNYYSETTSLAIGGVLSLVLGAVATLCALVNYFFASERAILSRCLRICFVIVGVAASIFALLPVLSVGPFTMAPGLYFIRLIGAGIAGGTIDNQALAAVLSMFVLLIVAYSFASNEGVKSVDERKKNDGRSVASIVLTAIALVLTIGALFGARLVEPTKAFSVSLYGILAIVFMVLTLALAILVFVFTKKEEVKVTPVEFIQPSEEQEVDAPKVEEEPAEEEVTEEPKDEETPVEEAPIEEPVKEEVIAATVATAAVEEEKEAEENPVEEKAKKEEAPKEKAAPKKKAPAKKVEEKKEEDKNAKKNASYHISKRASDNKWQVFRAGSDKVIKLFDTKVEAEEYTKRMAENQGVGYLSHASKGKNKGRIQKK